MHHVRAASVVLTLIAGGLVAANTQKPDNSPVTASEAKKVFSRIESALGRVVHAKHLAKGKLGAGSQPVTREQVVMELDRIALEFKPYYTNKPRTQYSRPEVLHLNGPAKVEALKLIKLGFLEPVNALVVGPKDTLTPAEFAESLGFFVARWCDMTHMPSARFSPGLMGGAATPKLPSGSKVRVP